MRHFYEYKVKIFDENTTDEVIKHGVTYSKSYGDAAAVIEKSYGDILISMVICKVENFGVEDGTYEFEDEGGESELCDITIKNRIDF